MKIVSAKYTNQDNTNILVNGQHPVPVALGNRYYHRVLDWVEQGGTIEAADPPPDPPTNSERIDLAGPILMAFLKAYADREGITLQQIKNAVIAEM